jgi:hypothetical protein
LPKFLKVSNDDQQYLCVALLLPQLLHIQWFRLTESGRNKMKSRKGGHLLLGLLIGNLTLLIVPYRNLILTIGKLRIREVRGELFLQKILEQGLRMLWPGKPNS